MNLDIKKGWQDLSNPEILSEESLIEVKRIPSTKEVIELMIQAGKRLYESSLYDFDDEVDENYEDPTRQPDFDMADASMIIMDIESKVDNNMNNGNNVDGEKVVNDNNNDSVRVYNPEEQDK